MKTFQYLKAALVILALTCGTLAVRADEGDNTSGPDGKGPGRKPKNHINGDNSNRKLKPKEKAAIANNGQGHKVSVNHKGHVITVNEHALQAHLNHGDAIVSGIPDGNNNNDNSGNQADDPTGPGDPSSKGKDHGKSKGGNGHGKRK